MAPVILDTNVFVAAGFNPHSASARILEQVRSGRLCMIWNEQTRRETRHILEKIPPLSWSSAAGLFREEDCQFTEESPEEFHYISDRDDRKFAALAHATEAVLLTNDDDLLCHRVLSGLDILTPREFLERQCG